VSEAVSDFLAMGGYGAYVWGSFGFMALMLGGLLAQSWWSARRSQSELDDLRRRVGPSSRHPVEARQPARPIVARREREAG
jgi:heme exporter protein D